MFVSQVNEYQDSEIGANYALRRYTMLNLTDIMAVEWTCNSSLGNAEGLGTFLTLFLLFQLRSVSS